MEFITLFESIRPVDTPSIIFAFLGLSVLIIPKNKIDKQTKNNLFYGLLILAGLSMIMSTTIRVIEILY